MGQTEGVRAAAHQEILQVRACLAVGHQPGHIGQLVDQPCGPREGVGLVLPESDEALLPGHMKRNARGCLMCCSELVLGFHPDTFARRSRTGCIVNKQ